MKTIKASELKVGDQPVMRGNKTLVGDKTVHPLIVRIAPHKNPKNILVYFSLSRSRNDFETQKFGATWKRDEEVTIQEAK